MTFILHRFLTLNIKEGKTQTTLVTNDNITCICILASPQRVALALMKGRF